MGALATGCGGDDALPVAELMDPATCATCHPKHHAEWASSMHAYAADDPVFLALNREGQEQTNGALGDFCVRCHAPVALAQGLTTDGLNLADVPQWAKGVTCYFCHNATEVTGDHNAPIRLAMDQTMRAGLKNPVTSPAHRSAYSNLLDATKPTSAALCGSCHDIVTPAGVHLERTFAEWQTTIFASPDPRQQLACGTCHMVATTDVIAEGPGFTAPLREFGRREHTFAGIDVATTPWPGRELQQAAIARDLAALLIGRLCVLPVDGGRIDYRLDNVGAGHMFPSGATADRRAWIEIVAYRDDGSVAFSSGLVPADQPYADPEDLADPNLWRLDTPTVDAAGQRTERFWNITSIDHPGTLLAPAVTTDPSDPRFYHAVERSFPVPGLVPQIARVTARVLIRPVPMGLVAELLGSGHLTVDIRDAIPTHEVTSASLEWTAATATSGCVQ
ncbi:MAG: multiheme c-type cytochrome [Kofleriaceae bacterium]